MRRRDLGVVLLTLAACDGHGRPGGPGHPGTPDAGSMPGAPDAAPIPPDAERTSDAAVVIDTPDAGTIPPDDGCASPPLGGWAGATKTFAQGSGPYQSEGADVTWTLVSTKDCVDHYAPSGTAWVDNQGYVCEANYTASTPIAASDGMLAIDRTSSPPTYTMSGATHWQITTDCPDVGPIAVVSRWASYRGVIDGDVFGGGHRQAGWDVYWQWRFARVGADLPAPDGCVAPIADSWTGTHTATGPGTTDLIVQVTWTRVSTEGCLDRFQPSGTATITIDPSSECTASWNQPDQGPVGPGDGSLEIDRSTNPPTFATQGSAGWEATIYCMQSDGTTTSYTSTVGNHWDEFGPLAGDIIAGTLVRELSEHSFRLTR